MAFLHQRGISLFHSLLPLGQHKYLSKGEILEVPSCGDLDRQVHLVGDGLVKMILQKDDGRSITALIARPGDVLAPHIQPPKAAIVQDALVLQAISSSNLLSVSKDQFDAV